MKKKFRKIAELAAALGLIVCISANAAGTFEVNKQIFSDKHIDLICKEINGDGITFECVNKTKRDIQMSYTIALDGVVQHMWSDVNESTVPAGETKVFEYHNSGELEKTEHKLLSMDGVGFVENTKYMSFEIMDFDLGGESNPDILESGEIVYDEEDYEIEFIGTTVRGIAFKFNNHRETTKTFLVDDVILNGDQNGYGSAFTVPGHSETVYEHAITNYIQEMNGDDIETFTANLEVFGDNGGTDVLCSVFYEDDVITSDHDNRGTVQEKAKGPASASGTNGAGNTGNSGNAPIQSPKQ